MLRQICVISQIKAYACTNVHNIFCLYLGYLHSVLKDYKSPTTASVGKPVCWVYICFTFPVDIPFHLHILSTLMTKT